MLNLLHIENAAVIEKADIEFEPGMNVLTGETGAGKSIIIDCINAILGERASRGLVRNGAQNAVITAEFSSDSIAKEWLEENDIEKDEEEPLIITRKISADGKNTCRINGVPVSTVQLRELGDRLIDVHGQNDGRRLLSEANHRAYLDSFGGLSAKLAEYKAEYDEYHALKKKIEALRENEADKEFRCEELKKKIKEIETAAPEEGEYEELSERRQLLNNAGRITDCLEGAHRALYGGDSSDGAVSLIIEAEGELSSARRFTDSAEDIAAELSDLRYRAEDIAERISSFMDELDFSPGELERIESRLSTLSRLRKKYGSVEETLEYLEKAKNELDDIEYLEDNLDKLEGELFNRRKKVKALAAELTESRKSAAKRLEERIISELSGLNMPGVRFQTELLGKQNEDGFDAAGADTVRFLMSANAGEELGRISKIASGGELSRIMLAMKTVLSGDDDAQTMIFDEIDTGVSGRAARKIAEKLFALSLGRQVLCVTHLPQLAVMADAQFLVEKGSSGERTYTNVLKLDEQGRAEEIARITGGAEITETLLSSASELFREAESFKKSLAQAKKLDK